MKTRVWVVEVKKGRRWEPYLPYLNMTNAEQGFKVTSLSHMHVRVTEYVPKARKRKR